MESQQPAKAESLGQANQEFLVFYSLSGVMLCQAADANAASEAVFATLHSLVGKARFQGISPAEADNVRLWEAEVEIDSVEAIESANGEAAAPVTFSESSTPVDKLSDNAGH